MFEQRIFVLTYKKNEKEKNLDSISLGKLAADLFEIFLNRIIDVFEQSENVEDVELIQFVKKDENIKEAFIKRVDETTSVMNGENEIVYVWRI